MSAYVELASLKEAIGLAGQSDDTVDDVTLRSCIWRASAVVDGWLERNRPGFVGFAASSNTRTAVGSNTRLYDGSGDDWQWVDDFASVAAVAVDGETIPASAWVAWPYNERPTRALVYVAPTTPGLEPASWAAGTANVAVTGYAGLATVPPDVEQTTLAVALLYWRRYQQGEPAPVVTPRGAQGFLMADAEVEGLLETGLAGWRVVGVWGA